MSEAEKKITRTSKKAVSVMEALGAPDVVELGGRAFDRSLARFGEQALVGRIGTLAVRLQNALRLDEFESAEEIQGTLIAAMARLFTNRAVDNEPVTAEWLSGLPYKDVESVFEAIMNGIGDDSGK